MGLLAIWGCPTLLSQGDHGRCPAPQGAPSPSTCAFPSGFTPELGEAGPPAVTRPAQQGQMVGATGDITQLWEVRESGRQIWSWEDRVGDLSPVPGKRSMAWLFPEGFN